jgi:dipeptidyl aminopeptidase/acylaminoacyl peptidase
MDDYRGRVSAIRDVIAAAEWSVSRGIAREGRMGIMGKSYGGAAGLLAMAEKPNMFSAGFFEAPISDMERIVESAEGGSREAFEREYGPLSDREFLQSISPIHRVEDIHARIMIVHGRLDRRVPYEQSATFVGKMREYERLIELIGLDGQGHSLGDSTAAGEVLREKVEFFESVFLE